MNYTGTTIAKDGSIIPVRDALCFHSKYNPAREAEQFAAQFADGSSFFVVLGLCGGYHLAALAKRFPQATLVAVEETDDDLHFLSALPPVQALLQNPRVIMTTKERFSLTLCQHFLPAEHTALQIAALRSWENAFPAVATEIKAMLNKTLSDISADFSVQSHFGGIWQRNILQNLRHAATQVPQTLTFPTRKIAAIIAAGPTLDDSWERLSARRDDYYIIATDTGYRALLRRGVVSDAVVCVDAQMVSHAHFFDLAPQTLCIFDLSAHPACVRKAAGHKATRRNAVLFIQTGHPLATYADETGTSFPLIHAGSGTVTIAAAFFAIGAGFERLQFFGADFAYSRGKAYAKGSYLDDLYHTASNRLNTAENQFNRLLYRTELHPCGNGVFTTDTLESYKNSLKIFLEANNFIKNADNIYIWHGDTRSAGAEKRRTGLAIQPFAYDVFARDYKRALQDIASNGKQRGAAFLTLLPYIAWLKKRRHQQDFESLVRMAYQKTWEYV